MSAEITIVVHPRARSKTVAIQVFVLPPALDASNLADVSTKHSEVPVPVGVKNSGADNVMTIHCLLLFFCHFTRNIDPYRISRNAILKILGVQIDSVPFKLQVEEADELHTFLPSNACGLAIN